MDIKRMAYAIAKEVVYFMNEINRFILTKKEIYEYIKHIMECLLTDDKNELINVLANELEDNTEACCLLVKIIEF